VACFQSHSSSRTCYALVCLVLIPTYLMNAGGLILSSIGRVSAAKSAVCRPSSSKCLSVVPRAHRIVSSPSLYSKSSYRNLFGFTFAPKQKEPAVTDGLAAYGVGKQSGADEDTSDQFDKNPIYLTKADAKEEYGFFRQPTTRGAGVSSFFPPSIVLSFPVFCGLLACDLTSLCVFAVL